MSLLKKASIITTPTAYAEDYLYSVKPAYALGSELVTNGTFDTDSNWLKGTGWTISGGSLNASATTDKCEQNTSVTTNRVYRVSYDIINYVSGSVRIEVGSGNVSVGATNSGNGTYVETITAAGDGYIIIDAIATFTGSIDNVSVKEITDADFDFTRASTGTRVNEDYLIEDVPYNLSTYSEDFNSWAQIQNVTLTENATLSPIGTGNATKVLATSTSAKVRNNFTCQNGVTYTFSIFCKNIDATTMTLLIYDGSASYSVDKISEVSTDAWSRISISFTATQNSTLGQIQFARDLPNGESAFFWGAQLVKGDKPKDYLKTTDRLDIPRIDYTNGEPSILLEPSRTNRLDYSQDLTQWTNKSNTSVNASTELSPEGIANANLLENTGSPSAFLGNSALTVTIGTTYTFSFFVKKVNNTWVRIGHVSSATTGCWFDLDNGVVGTVNSTSATIEKYPNNWYRITNTFVATAGAGTAVAFIGISQGDGSTVAETGKQLLIYGAQVEAGSYATSLIHTSGSAVTRSQDAATNAGNSDLIGSTEGVLYAEIKALADDGNIKHISLSDGSTNNRIIIAIDGNNDVRFYYQGTGGSVLVSFSNQSLLFSKIAIRYKSGNFCYYINGAKVGVNTSAISFSGLNDLSFNNPYQGGTSPFYGNCKMVAVFKEALTDLELECLTGYNNHELYMNYYNRLSYLGLVEEYNVESDINNYIL